MGEVWLAEQRQLVRRRVAIKLIKAGMDTREVVARFESERQALALIRRVLGPEHPDTLKTTSNLAWTLEQEGRYSKAEKLQRETLDILASYPRDGSPGYTGDTQQFSRYLDAAAQLRGSGEALS
jgi:hypothetical protein